MFQSKSFTWPLFMNLFRMVFITKTVKLTHFQKNWKNTLLVNSKKGKSGKVVFKKKPSKSDINKLTLFYQFMAACKKLEQPNLTILRTRLIFWNLAISIYSNIVVSDHSKKTCKNHNFCPILTIWYSIPTKSTMASSNKPSKLTFSHFLTFSFFW